LFESIEPEADFLPVKVEYTAKSAFDPTVIPLSLNSHRLRLTQDCVHKLRTYLAHFRPTLVLSSGEGEEAEEEEGEEVQDSSEEEVQDSSEEEEQDSSEEEERDSSEEEERDSSEEEVQDSSEEEERDSSEEEEEGEEEGGEEGGEEVALEGQVANCGPCIDDGTPSLNPREHRKRKRAHMMEVARGGQ